MTNEKCIMPDRPPYWRNYDAVKNHREMFHKHHVFAGYNRGHSDEDGLVIFLTPTQHEQIHKNQNGVWLMAKQEAQRVYEAKLGSRIDFIKRYGKSYL